MAGPGTNSAFVYFTFFISLSTFFDSKHLAKGFVEHRNLHAPHHRDFLPNEHNKLHSDALKRSQSTFSVVIDPIKPHLSSFIHLINPVEVFDHTHHAHIEYSCSEGDLIAAQIFLQSDDIPESPLRVFHQDWTCNRYSSGTRHAYVHLTLPDWLAYRPDNLQPVAVNVISLELKIWIISKHQIVSCVRWSDLNCHDRAHVKGVYPMKMVAVYRRQRRNYDSDVCLSFDSWIKLHFLNENEFLQSELEEEILQLVDFPVALANAYGGITKDVPPFQEIGLINEQHRNRFNPKFTISMMIFLLEYCSYDLCSIMHRKSPNTNQYITPLLFLTRKGLIHVQVVLDNGQAFGMLSNYHIPLKEWVRLVYKQDGSRWTLSVSSGRNFTNVIVSGSVFPKPVHYEETEGLIHLGGSNACKAFKGFIADTWLWRTTATSREPRWNFSNPVLMEKISSYVTGCEGVQKRMLAVFEMYQKQWQAILAQNSCPSTLPSLLEFPSTSPSDTHQPVCQPWDRRPPKGYRHLWGFLRMAAINFQGYKMSFDFIGKRLHEKAAQYLAAGGLSEIPAILPFLRQASCYGNHKSSYMLGTLYAGGINVDVDLNEAYLYWLVAAEAGNRLAMLALANHHQQGLSTASTDFDLSYNYLKRLADLTVKDRERHDPNGVLTEYVRLTDTDSLKVHKGEDGDHFLWLKYQARKGIAQAQLDMARILFWGQRGIDRDVQQAVELYRLYLMDNPQDEVVHYDYGIIHLQASIARLKFWGSEGVKRDMKTAVKYYEKTVKEMPQNSVALYDYGIVLLRGQGTKKNVEKGHGPAYTALGWYAINFQHDMKAAAKYFDIAARMGHRDAMHNLGYMYKAGQYPGKPVDEAKAFLYFQKAADRGHIDSAGVIAEIYSQGSIGVERNSYSAVFWSRFVCEKNPEIGMVLRKGLDAFLAGSWGESIVYYMMVAETGVEVAQFNLAHLCEEDHDGQVFTYIQTDCTWKYYNLSSHAAEPHVISQLKMGDFYYYGQHGDQDKTIAVQYYSMAAMRRDPQALFNLAYLLEEGTEIDNTLWKSLHIPSDVYNSDDKTQLIMAVYRRCRDGGSKDSYLPCGLALLRVQLLDLWSKYTLAVKVSIALMLGIITLSYIGTALHHIRESRQQSDTPSGQSSEN
ncbi:protein sel-1 homolog 3-like [Acanthaster planci]|uniref:Protein sel-1 homolog 3-like n=1 Tax=Acanthaster planci TaxID=133434 RepID=A0A8B7ZT84_ACAPL|nr:protein sel-1 homolog 3-like [Acanthaster planci]